MKIEITEFCWINNKPYQAGDVVELDDEKGKTALRFGNLIEEKTETKFETITKTPEYETKVILPKVKGKKK